jgi:hypothetical protein
MPLASGSAGSADLRPEQLRRPQLAAARLAVDGEYRGEADVAGRAAGANLTAALRARGRELALPVLEVALREPAAEADGDPVAEHLAALLPQPVGGLAHGDSVVQ